MDSTALTKTIAITGASGFVGSALVAACAARPGLEVRAFTRSPLEWDWPQVKNMPIQALVQPDAADVAPAMLQGVDVLVHTAARVHVMHDTSGDPLAAFRAVNVQATVTLARRAAAAGVRRFVFVSSAKVNGEATEPGKPFTETWTPQPTDPYAISKWEAEQALATIAQETGMEVVIIRPPLVYGPGVKANFAALMRLVRSGLPLPLGALHNRRSLVGLNNLVGFIMTCVWHPQAANQTWLISDGFDVSTTRLVQTMAQTAGVPARLIPVPAGLLRFAGKLLGKAAAVDRLCGNLQLDISKASTQLAWRPAYSFDQGIELAMQYSTHNQTAHV